MSAIISSCGAYRYRLERQIREHGKTIAYFGVNPSTADAENEDQTTRKWRHFAYMNNARRYIAGNPFGGRATSVKDLAAMSDPVGPDNRHHLLKIIYEADVLVPCWGSRTKIPRRLHHHLDELAGRLFDSGKPVMTFGLTRTGDPKHPLFLSYSTDLKLWRPR